jgi:5-(aminomethyl)-3-furanmethanol phosphate kinase
VPDVVIKVGGSLLADVEQLDGALDAIALAARTCRLLIVPGGGPFADAVRDVDRRVGLSDEAAHWMAVLAMDQYAHLLAARIAGGAVVTTVRDATRVLDAAGVPVLAPSRWLSDADPLPHSWDVTGDSIAGWVAGQVQARALILVKAPGAIGGDLVDRHFARIVPAHLVPIIVPGGEVAVALAQIGGNVKPAGEMT